MAPQKVTPLKVGLLIVAFAYFLFNAHSLFNLNWVGEWNRFTNISASARFDVYITDVSAFAGIVPRFIAGIIAISSVIYYMVKGTPSINRIFNILKAILVLEAIYWFGLVTTAAVEIRSLIQGPLQPSIINALASVMSGALPNLVESVVLPIVLLILAFKLNPNKPSSAIKWALISGTLLVFVFWLTNMSIWIEMIQVYGTSALTNYTVNTVSFILTVFGLLALALSLAGFTIASVRKKMQPTLNLRIAGAIITAFGLYFLWEYLSWIFFGGDYLWSDWYAWFLGHNLDLWLLSLPMLGLPLLFTNKRSPRKSSFMTRKLNQTCFDKV